MNDTPEPVYTFEGHAISVNRAYIPSLIDGWHPDMNNIPRQPTPEERQEMTWTNPEARDIAREILSEKKKDELRVEVTEAVANLQEMVAGSACGSVFTFRKTNDGGRHYWYAAIKNGGKWYTTANNPRILDNDELFIEWLISLEAWKSEGLELQLPAGVSPERPVLETTATDE